MLNEVTKKDKVSLKVFFLMLSIVFSFVNTFEYGGGISSIIVFIIGFGIAILFENAKLVLDKTHLLVIIFWFILLLSTILSEYTTIQQDIFSFLVAALFYIITTAVKYNKKEIKYILIAYITVASISSLNIIYNLIIKHQVTWNRYSTSFFGVDKDPNYASAFILPVIMLLLHTILFGKNKNKVLLIILLIIISVATISTGSRTAFVFVVFCYLFNLLTYLVTNNRGGNKIIIAASIVILVLIIGSIVAYYLPGSTINRITTISSYTEDVSRTTLWKVSITNFYKHPILGCGLNGSNSYLLSLGYNYSHNVYLDILTNTGIVGSSIFVIIFYLLSRIRSKDRLIIIGIMITMLGPLFFINGFNTPSFWIPIILIAIFKKYSNEDQISIARWLD